MLIWIKIRTCLHSTCVFVSYLKNESRGYSSPTIPRFFKHVLALCHSVKHFLYSFISFTCQGNLVEMVVPFQVQRSYKVSVQSLEQDCKTIEKDHLCILKLCDGKSPGISLTSVISDVLSSLKHVCTQACLPCSPYLPFWSVLGVLMCSQYSVNSQCSDSTDKGHSKW